MRTIILTNPSVLRVFSASLVAKQWRVLVSKSWVRISSQLTTSSLEQSMPEMRRVYWKSDFYGGLDVWNNKNDLCEKVVSFELTDSLKQSTFQTTAISHCRVVCSSVSKRALLQHAPLICETMKVKDSFQYERLWTKTRFETEARATPVGNNLLTICLTRSLHPN